MKSLGRFGQKKKNVTLCNVYCLPGFDLAVELPDKWNTKSVRNQDNFDFFPNDSYGVGASGSISSCGLTIQKWDWFKADVVDNEQIDGSKLIEEWNNERDPNSQLFNKKIVNVQGSAGAEIVSYEKRISDLHFRLEELHIIKKDQYKGKPVFRRINVSCSALKKEFKRYEIDFSNILSNVSCNVESDLGICFIIEELEKIRAPETNYAEEAFREYLPYINPEKVAGATVRRGDIFPEARLFCIQVSSWSMETCPHLREVFGWEGAKDYMPGIAEMDERFLSGASLEVQPLPVWAQFDQSGVLRKKLY